MPVLSSPRASWLEASTSLRRSRFPSLAAGDVVDAYADLSSRTCGLVRNSHSFGQPDAASQHLLPGAALHLNGNLILDGAGDPNALFIFQIDGALAADPFSTITLINGANLCNVFFQVNGEVSLGTNAFFQGTIVAAGAINLGTGASLIGRGLTTAGAIATSANIVELPAFCATSVPPTITCAADVTVSCASQVPAADPLSVAVTVTCPGGFTVVLVGDVISNQTCTNQYVITRTYEVTDACGLTATCAQTITVLDQTPPVITGCVADVTVTRVLFTPGNYLSFPDNSGRYQLSLLQSGDHQASIESPSVHREATTRYANLDSHRTDPYLELTMEMSGYSRKI